MKTAYYPQCAAILSVIFDGLGGEDSEPIQFAARPRSATVNLNGYSEADTFDLEFDARVLPVDPQQIRSAAVGIYMFDAGALRTPDDWARPEYQRVVGLVDEASLGLSEDGQSIAWSGRDYTALLLDIEWDPTQRIDTGRRLSEVIQSIIDTTGLENMRVIYDSDVQEPVVRNANRGSKKNGQPVAPGKNVWDVIYETCISMGFIVYVDGEDLEGGRVVITEPRVQTDKTASQAPIIVWGQNLKSLEISRKLGKERMPRIEAVTINPRTGTVMRAVFPESKKDIPTAVGLKEKTTRGRSKKKPSVTTKRDILRVTAPPGISDLDTLKRYARTRWENMARTEAVYAWSSGLHLESVDGQSLLDLRAGSPLQIGFDAFNGEQMRQLSPAQRVEHMIAQGYNPRVAQVIANNFERLALLTQPSYTRVATFRFNDESGIEIEGESANYSYVPREDV